MIGLSKSLPGRRSVSRGVGLAVATPFPVPSPHPVQVRGSHSSLGLSEGPVPGNGAERVP